MDVSPLSTVGNQAKAAVKNLSAGVSAGIKSETSITGRAAALAGSLLQSSRQRMKAAGRKRRPKTGVYVLTEEEARAKDSAGELFIAPDGYVRKTPVQGIVLVPGYHRKIVGKVVSFILFAALIVGVVYILAKYNVINF